MKPLDLRLPPGRSMYLAEGMVIECLGVVAITGYRLMELESEASQSRAIADCQNLEWKFWVSRQAAAEVRHGWHVPPVSLIAGFLATSLAVITYTEVRRAVCVGSSHTPGS